MESAPPNVSCKIIRPLYTPIYVRDGGHLEMTAVLFSIKSSRTKQVH